MPGDDPDRYLWQQAQQGNSRAFDRLRGKHTRLVYAQIGKYSVVGYDDREDLAQEVWRAVWKSLPRFRGDATFGTWLGGVVKNVVFDRLRRTIPLEQAVVSLPEERIGDTEPFAAGWTDHLALHIATTKLPCEDREVIHWCFVLQLTEEEAAEQIGIPLGTLKSRKRAALKRLRAALGGTDGEDEPSQAGKATYR